MKIRSLMVTALLTCTLAAQTSPQKSPGKAAKAPTEKAAPAKNAFTPDQVQYGPPPPSVPPGAEMAVLEGNPGGTTGDFTIRVKIPSGYKIPPHWHPKRENVTVISGTLKVGMGDTFDESKMTSFGAGSFAYLDPSMHHYVDTAGETVIQVHGMAPLKLNYINPKDDPSKSPKK
jgi:quercetin dioxygenase-like cupin family protein